MDSTGVLGIFAFAIGGLIVFFTTIFSIQQTESAPINFSLLMSAMSVFVFIGLILAALGLYSIFKSATRNLEQP
jgi:hypothetical protein